MIHPEAEQKRKDVDRPDRVEGLIESRIFKAEYAAAARTSACSSHADRASPGAMLAHFETLSTTAPLSQGTMRCG